MRHMPNLRRYARERPQRWQRWYFRTPNFGVRFAFSINDFFATRYSFSSVTADTAGPTVT